MEMPINYYYPNNGIMNQENDLMQEDMNYYPENLPWKSNPNSFRWDMDNKFSNIQDGIGSIKLPEQFPGMAMSILSGVPLLGSAMNFIGDQFEYKPAEIYADEYGRVYNPKKLDRANARGGWYTEPARASRRRDARIDWMEKRKAAGKRFSENNLARLQEQQRQEEAARVAATKKMAAQNAQTYGTDDATGGYQSSWGGNEDFMSGSGTTDDMGSFAHGGLASLWQR